MPALLVGVRCPLPIILERRRATGWGESRPTDTAESGAARWQVEVHNPGIYDLEVDTAVLSPAQCAQAIRQRLESGPAPTAMQRLAAMVTEPS